MRFLCREEQLATCLILTLLETPYPSAAINHPPGGAINYTTYPPTGANYDNYFIGVQSVVIDSKDRLWVLDTGRVLTPGGVLVGAAYGKIHLGERAFRVFCSLEASLRNSSPEYTIGAERASSFLPKKRFNALSLETC